MKTEKRRAAQRVLAVYRDMLVRLEAMGPESSAPDDLEGFGEVKDVLAERIAYWQARAQGVPA